MIKADVTAITAYNSVTQELASTSAELQTSNILYKAKVSKSQNGEAEAR